MHKKILLLIACAGLVFNINACTSKDSKQDSEVASEYDSSELEGLEEQSDSLADAPMDESATSTDQLPEEALGEVAPPEATTMADSSSSSDLNVDSSSSGLETPVDTSADSMIGSTDTSTSIDSSSTTELLPPADNTTYSSTTEVDSEPAPKPAPVPLQKVAAAPWKVGKTWANTVYFARPGDSLASISQNIYGTDKSDELKKINPTYKNREVKPGDKVYYNSPNRSEDSERVLTYFEDTGVQPEIYVAQAGDNIRAVSKKLLGYDGAWKEVWSSNSVDSKSAIDAGTELRYWKGSMVAAAPAAPAPSEMTAPPAVPPSAPGEMPPPPPMDMAQSDFPPPPPPPEMGHEMPPPPPMDMAQNDLPPPPPMDMNTPPPPPPPPMEHTNEPAAGMDNDTTMALAVVGLSAAGLAILIVMRKKRKQRELEQALNDTQVGT